VDALIAGGTGQVVVGDGVLTLIAAAPDSATLTRVQHVLGSHLERFGQRNELTVTWYGDADPVVRRPHRRRRTTSGPTATERRSGRSEASGNAGQEQERMCTAWQVYPPGV
jgi:hypothetical protein